MDHPVAPVDAAYVVGHTASLVTVFGTLLGWLPHIAALLAAVWYSVQIWESKTLQKRIKLWRFRRNLRKSKSTPPVE